VIHHLRYINYKDIQDTNYIKSANAQQAKTVYNYKNTNESQMVFYNIEHLFDDILIVRACTVLIT